MKQKLLISEIILENFKSYEGRHVLSGLDRNFTAVIGPNGSGKSNIIDSLLFLFGYRARKMRQSVSTDLIYKDNSRRKYCSVEVIFNKGDTLISLRRKLNINKKSQYFFNGKEENMNKIREYMKNEGVDIENNRFLILQGEIENISLMKPKEGLLEYLEDIIGSNNYIEDIEKLEEEVKEVKENFEARKTEYKFYEKEFIYVENKKNENLESFNLRAKNLKYSLNLKNTEIEINRRKLKNLKEEEIKVEKKIKQIENKSLGNNTAINKKEKQILMIKNKLYKIEAEYFNYKKIIQKIERDNKNEIERKKRVEKKIENLKYEIEEKKAKLKIYNSENEVMEKEIKENENELKNLKVNLEGKLDEIKIINENKEAKKILKEKENLEKKIIKLIKEKNKLLENENIFYGEIENLKKERNALKNRIKNEINENFKLLEENKLLIQNGERVEIDENKFKKILKETENEVKKYRNEILEREKRIEELGSKNKSERQKTEIFKKIKHIEGVFGRLGDLGSVDKKYEQAVFSASKGQINNIVVDKTSTAEKCISIIKKEGLAKTTFIILDKMKSIPNLQKEKVSYLIDLIKCDDMHKKCFFFVLKDTLLCKDVDEASKVSFGVSRKRTVTLSGTLIEKNGLMSNFKMYGSLVSKDKLEGELEKLNKKLSEVENERKNLLSGAENIKNYYFLEEKLKKIEDKIKIKEEESKNIKKSEEIEKLEELIRGEKNKIKSHDKKLDSIQGIGIKGKRAEIEILYEQIDLLEKRNSDLKISQRSFSIDDLKSKEKLIKKLEKEHSEIKVEDFQKEKEKFEKIENEYKEKTNDIKILSNELNELKEEIGTEYQKLVEMKTKLDETKEDKKNVENKINQKKNELQKINYEIKEIKNVGENEIEMPEEENIDYKSIEYEELEDMVENYKKIIKAEDKKVNWKILEEFSAKRNEFENINKTFSNFKNKMNKKIDEYNTLKNKRFTEFKEGFDEISSNLKKVYSALTFGGSAELEMINYCDPFSDGIILSVKPPKKTWNNISNLSGGEKTLSSLALVFALHQYKPSPFYVMDEIDAALDYKNVGVIANYINKQATDAQFLVISLRSNMFELANVLAGVYKFNGVSKIIKMDVNKFEANKENNNILIDN